VPLLSRSIKNILKFYLVVLYSIYKEKSIACKTTLIKSSGRFPRRKAAEVKFGGLVVIRPARRLPVDRRIPATVVTVLVADRGPTANRGAEPEEVSPSVTGPLGLDNPETPIGVLERLIDNVRSSGDKSRRRPLGRHVGFGNAPRGAHHQQHRDQPDQHRQKILSLHC